MVTTNEPTHPLRLATGAHREGSGAGCAMNVISWESGDTFITDYPDCSDRFLARLVQMFNDSVCSPSHGAGFTVAPCKCGCGKGTEISLLCAECSVEALALAHRTVGTAGVMTASEKILFLERCIDWCVVHDVPTRPAAMSLLASAIRRPSDVDHLGGEAITALLSDRSDVPFVASNLIDIWFEVAGVEPTPAPPAEITEAALVKMAQS